MSNQTQQSLVRVEDLKTHFRTMDGIVRAVDGVTIEIHPGEALGLVGESGCGKSVTAFSIMRLLPPKTSRIVQGKILFNRGDGSQSVDLATIDPNGEIIRSIRGNEIAMIFQEPLTSLSPVHTVGSQIAEAVELHQNATQQESKERAIQMLEAVGIAMPAQRYSEFPHQFSGGMRQRAMIAMALSCHPKLLIADEPTTALDVTIQAQILELMKSLQSEIGMSILMITHNLGVIAETCKRVAVMYMGKVVEDSNVRAIFRNPLHPYTIGLMRSVPHMGSRVKDRLTPIPGSVPDPYSIPKGCAFFPRCPAPKKPECREEVPLTEIEPGHFVRCTLYQ